MIIALLLIAVCSGSRKVCSAEHTGIPLGHHLMVASSFGGGQPPCKKFNRVEFNAAYPHDSKQFHIEHIVELQNSEPSLANCDKDIYGNIILANATWNRAVGNLCWKYTASEKQIVYGAIFQQAMDNVRQCCINEPTTPPTLPHGRPAYVNPPTTVAPLAPRRINSWKVVITILLVALVTLTFCVVAIPRR